SEHPAPLVTALTHLIESDHLSVDQLAVIADAVPQQTQALARFAADLQNKITAVYARMADQEPDAYLPGLAGALNNLSVRLRELGRREEGLAAVQRAIDVRGRLAASTPAAYLPSLAAALNTLSLHVAQLGLRGYAPAAQHRATAVYARLAAPEPDAYLPGLAASLNNLSVWLGELGRREEGLAAVQRAIN